MTPGQVTPNLANTAKLLFNRPKRHDDRETSPRVAIPEAGRSAETVCCCFENRTNLVDRMNERSDLPASGWHRPRYAESKAHVLHLRRLRCHFLPPAGGVWAAPVLLRALL
jgi:hypothetical protein